MKSNYPKKTLGPIAADFLIKLYEQDLTSFIFSNMAELTGAGENSNRKLLQRLVESGVVAKIKPGLYKVVPYELGRESIHVGDPHIVASEIIKKAYKDLHTLYYISHGSAMNLHQMLTQPQMMVYATVCKQIKPNFVYGTEFRFITCPLTKIFGFQKFWVNKSEFVLISDIERTIIDGLRMPQYCGGLIEVAKGLWIKRDEINLSRLLSYEKKLNIGAVKRRLGYLLNVLDIGPKAHLERLKSDFSKTYHILDPTLLNEGKFSKEWGLRLNITEDEIKAIVRT